MRAAFGPEEVETLVEFLGRLSEVLSRATRRRGRSQVVAPTVGDM
jgi:hypothetical protein